jgi:regulatory protein
MRIVRFDDTSEPDPERAAPVARFGEDASGPSEPPGADDAAGMFDRLDAPAAAPVASVGETAPETDDAAVPSAGIADIAGSSGRPAAVFRAAELTGMGPGGRRRRRSATAEPTPRSGAAASVDAPAVPPRGRRAAGGAAGPAEYAEPSSEQDEPTDGNGPRRSGRSGDRRARRDGGFGGRGKPAELDPDADPIAVAREVCLRLLADRARTRRELAQALTRKGVPDEAAHTVLERFDEVGLIDDAALAGQWVRSRHNHRGLARRAIAMELRRKGVDDEVASEALDEVDQESEECRARELVDRKLRTVPADTPEQRRKAATRLVGMLARKGYGGGVAYRVVREALAAHGAEIDELGTDPTD